RLRLHVVGQDVGATTYRRMRLRRAIEREGGSGARAELDTVDSPSPSDDLDGVTADRLADAYAADLLAQLRDLRRAQDRLERLGANLRGAVNLQDAVLIVRVRVAQVQQEEESVELCLGQRERSLQLHRVLCRDDQEWVRQGVRGLVDG